MHAREVEVFKFQASMVASLETRSIMFCCSSRFLTSRFVTVSWSECGKAWVAVASSAFGAVSPPPKVCRW